MPPHPGGEVVEAEQVGPRRLGLPQARVVARLGDPVIEQVMEALPITLLFEHRSVSAIVAEISRTVAPAPLPRAADHVQ